MSLPIITSVSNNPRDSEYLLQLQDGSEFSYSREYDGVSKACAISYLASDITDWEGDLGEPYSVRSALDELSRRLTDAIIGGGAGDVVGPGSAVDGNIASYNGVTGKLIKDSLVSAASVVVGPGSAVDGNIASYNGVTGKLIKDSLVSAASVVVGPGSAVDNRLAAFDGVTGKLIKDSGTLVTDLVTDHGALAGLGDDDHAQYMLRTDLDPWIIYNLTDSDEESILWIRSRVGPAVVQSGDILGQLTYYGYDGAGTAKSCMIQVAANENWGAAAHGTNVSFHVTGVGDNDNPKEVLRLEGVDTPVNYLTIANADAAGVPPTGQVQIKAEGTSSNLGLTLRTKGTGALSLDDEVLVTSNVLTFYQDGTNDPYVDFSVADNLTISIVGTNQITIASDDMTFLNGATTTGLSWTTNGELGFKVGSTQEMTLMANKLEFNNGVTKTNLNWQLSGSLALEAGVAQLAVFSATGLDITGKVRSTMIDLDAASSTGLASVFRIDSSVDATGSSAAAAIGNIPTSASNVFLGWKRGFYGTIRCWWPVWF